MHVLPKLCNFWTSTKILNNRDMGERNFLKWIKETRNSPVAYWLIGLLQINSSSGTGLSISKAENKSDLKIQFPINLHRIFIVV